MKNFYDKSRDNESKSISNSFAFEMADQNSLKVFVDSDNVSYEPNYITSKYVYTNNEVILRPNGLVHVKPVEKRLEIRTSTVVNRLGLMIVGWGGNNGSTLTAAVEAHRQGIVWNTKQGVRQPDWLGSLTQSSTIQLGYDPADGSPVYVPFKNILPTVDPKEIVIDGWDISSKNLRESVKRAGVLDVDLQQKLAPFLEGKTPRPSIYKEKYIAANQAERADNVIEGSNQNALNQIRKDIVEIKGKCDTVVVVWSANTECLVPIIEGIHDSAENLMRAIENDREEISPSILFAVASILEKCPFINGSPQNTFVPGIKELAELEGSWIAGDDFKTGQTRMKSVLVDFLVSSGLKPVVIASYNHLGNNDGKNLSANEQYQAKKASKTNVIDDAVSSNSILYGPNEKVDHTVIIEYLPYLGDSKRAMDEYTSEILFGGTNTIVLHNVCEDSLLAVPIILDLVILTELASRLSFRVLDSADNTFHPFVPELSILSYMFKAPIIPQRGYVVNALNKQRACIINIIRACLGLSPEHHMDLETKLPNHIFEDTEEMVDNRRRMMQPFY